MLWLLRLIDKMVHELLQNFYTTIIEDEELKVIMLLS